mmetsp:Transcript_23007/g.35614  ORF Transcript_23007/g.35614 Transcript_23007/m.35614 type:complete len:216 (+) Transcript_23007:135-782(+)
MRGKPPPLPLTAAVRRQTRRRWRRRSGLSRRPGGRSILEISARRSSPGCGAASIRRCPSLPTGILRRPRGDATPPLLSAVDDPAEPIGRGDGIGKRRPPAAEIGRGGHRHRRGGHERRTRHHVRPRPLARAAPGRKWGGGTTSSYNLDGLSPDQVPRPPPPLLFLGVAPTTDAEEPLAAVAREHVVVPVLDHLMPDVRQGVGGGDLDETVFRGVV